MKAMMMIEAAQLVAKTLGKYIMYLEIPPADYMSILQSAPYLNLREHGDFIDAYGGLLIYDDRGTMEGHYNLTNCDDENDVIIVAVCIGPDGEILEDNR